jgi:hypothetical protein
VDGQLAREVCGWNETTTSALAGAIAATAYPGGRPYWLRLTKYLGKVREIDPQMAEDAVREAVRWWVAEWNRKVGKGSLTLQPAAVVVKAIGMWQKIINQPYSACCVRWEEAKAQAKTLDLPPGIGSGLAPSWRFFAALHQINKGKKFPASRRGLAKATGIPEGSIQGHCQTLQDLGYLELVARGESGPHATGKAHEWRWHNPPLPGGAPGLADPAPTALTNDANPST